MKQLKSTVARDHFETWCKKKAKTDGMTSVEKEQFISKAKQSRCGQVNILTAFVTRERTDHEKDLTLAFGLAKAKLPFTAGDTFKEIAKKIDPASLPFSRLHSSASTVGRNTEEIGDNLLSACLTKVREAPFVHVMCDESTDYTDKTQLLIYQRYVDTTDKEIKTEFLSLVEIRERCTAVNISEAIISHFDKEEFPTEKLVGFTSDGAAVMLGRNQRGEGNVAAKLKQEYGELFVQHCMTHRQALMSRDAEKEIPDFVEDTIKATLSHFNGPARKKEFSQICAFNEEEYSHLVTYKKIRWLSLAACVARFVELRASLVQYFDQTAHSSEGSVRYREGCANLADMLQNPKFLLYLLFLNWILPQLAHMNEALQKENTSLYTAYNDVQKYMRVIQRPFKQNRENNDLFVEPGELIIPSSSLNEFIAECKNQHHLSDSEMMKFNTTLINYAKRLQIAFQTRFPERELVRQMSFIDPLNPRPAETDMRNIAQRFSRHTSVPALLSQYQIYCEDDGIKTLLLSDRCKSDVVKFWCHLFENSDEYSELSKLAILLLTLSPDTCSCERGFSHMNGIKTQTRNRLGECRVDACLRIATSKYTVANFPVSKFSS